MWATEKLRWVLCAGLLGLWAGQFQFIALPWTALFCLLGFIYWQARPSFWWGMTLLFGLSLLYSQWQPLYSDTKDDLVHWHTKNVTIQGVIDSWPERRENSQKVFVQAYKINQSQLIKGRFLLTGAPDEDWQYGQTITAIGKLQAPRNFADFDYAGYLRRFQIRSVMNHPKSIVLGTHSSHLKPLVWLRGWFEDNLNRHLPRPNRELAAGVLIGTKATLPEPTQTYFKQAGLQHLIVVSGSNVVILMALVAYLAGPLGPFLKMLISGTMLLIFVFITGAEPPVLRASLFGLVIILASYRGQLIDIRNLLLLAGVLIGLANPLIVQQDVSFWLSFSATAGIILGFPIYRHYCLRSESFKVLKMLLGISLSAQLAVLPVLIMNFGTFPWVGLLSNLLAEPIIPFTMASSLIAGLSGIFPESIATYLAIPALICTEWLHLIAHIFGPWPGLVLPTWFGKILAFIWFLLAFWALFADYNQRK